MSQDSAPAEEACSYGAFFRRQKRFLRKHAAGATSQERRRPLHFIEEVGLETALWPHLYWRTTMCESFERLNVSRLAVRTDAAAEHTDEACTQQSDDASADDEGTAERPHSIKRSFAAKLASRLLGYGNDFALLQYVYDLHLWTDLGSKRQQNCGPNMRLKMKGHPMSPLYWKDLKYALFDLVRQLGFPHCFPHLYWTIAPYERSYPYHTFLLDEMRKLLCARMRLPAFEAMHLAHTLMQVCSGLLAGYGKDGKGVGWTQHLLNCKNEIGKSCCLHFFARLEFQDGSKKSGAQRYHGSGRPHVHALFWLKDMSAAGLETVVSVTRPDERQENLAAWVQGSQLDAGGLSCWPVHDGASGWDPLAQLQRMQHTAEDATDGLRGYFVDIMDALRCHQDVQIADGRALLLQYVAKYVAKWSDSSYEEWLSDKASATSMCRKVLFEYHPLEPEMALQLTNAVHRQWALGTATGGRRSVRAPRPAEEDAQPEFVLLYLACRWRRGDMCLLEWLRQTDQRGRVAAWLRQKHGHAQKEGTLRGLTLEAYANAYRMQGEQLVAVEYLWRLNDHFYGQWLMMHIPFTLRAFDRPAVRAAVPACYRWFATALHITDDADAAPADLLGYWRDVDRQSCDMRKEGDGESFIADMRSFVQAHVLAMDQYARGIIGPEDERPTGIADVAVHTAHTASSAPPVEFRGMQLRLYRMAQKIGESEGLVVDTFVAALQLHLPESEGLFALQGYDLVVIDEYSQLGMADFERLLRLWNAADCLPALVILGDKYQLPGIDPRRAWESVAWRAVTLSFIELHEVFRVKDFTFLETLHLLRTCMPTKQQLNRVCRGHKACSGDEPSVEDIRRLLRRHPGAVFVAATRRGVALINRLALEAQHPRAQPLVVLPGAYEDNAENYVGGALRTGQTPRPSDVPIYAGSVFYLTRNVRKSDDFINGMRCRVLSYDLHAGVLWVRTDTGKRLPVTACHDPRHRSLVYFPIRLGYCSTIAKVQGDEFPFLIIYLDAPNLPAVGYTALSRVRDSDSHLLGGHLTPQHFTPMVMR